MSKFSARGLCLVFMFLIFFFLLSNNVYAATISVDETGKRIFYSFSQNKGYVESEINPSITDINAFFRFRSLPYEKPFIETNFPHELIENSNFNHLYSSVYVPNVGHSNFKKRVSLAFVKKNINSVTFTDCFDSGVQFDIGGASVLLDNEISACVLTKDNILYKVGITGVSQGSYNILIERLSPGTVDPLNLGHPQGNYCRDYDGFSTADIYSASSVTVFDNEGGNGLVRAFDQCKDDSVLHERFCDGNNIKTKVHVCESGCVLDKCNSFTPKEYDNLKFRTNIVRSQNILYGDLRNPGISTSAPTGNFISINTVYIEGGFNSKTDPIIITTPKSKVAPLNKNFDIVTSQECKTAIENAGTSTAQIPETGTLCIFVEDTYAKKQLMYKLKVEKDDNFNYILYDDFKDDPLLPASCVDTDGGQNFLVQGTVTYNLENTREESRFDTCPGPGPTRLNVYEYYCEGSELKTLTKECPLGCDGGKCSGYLEVSDIPSTVICEKEYDIYKKDKLYVRDSVSNQYFFSGDDYCKDENTLIEMECKEGTLDMSNNFREVICSAGCVSGACVMDSSELIVNSVPSSEGVHLQLEIPSIHQNTGIALVVPKGITSTVTYGTEYEVIENYDITSKLILITPDADGKATVLISSAEEVNVVAYYDSALRTPSGYTDDASAFFQLNPILDTIDNNYPTKKKIIQVVPSSDFVLPLLENCPDRTPFILLEEKRREPIGTYEIFDLLGYAKDEDSQCADLGDIVTIHEFEVDESTNCDLDGRNKNGKDISCVEKISGPGTFTIPVSNEGKPFSLISWTTTPSTNNPNGVDKSQKYKKIGTYQSYTHDNFGLFETSGNEISSWRIKINDPRVVYDYDKLLVWFKSWSKDITGNSNSELKIDVVSGNSVSTSDWKLAPLDWKYASDGSLLELDYDSAEEIIISARSTDGNPSLLTLDSMKVYRDGFVFEKIQDAKYYENYYDCNVENNRYFVCDIFKGELSAHNTNNWGYSEDAKYFIELTNSLGNVHDDGFQLIASFSDVSVDHLEWVTLSQDEVVAQLVGVNNPDARPLSMKINWYVNDLKYGVYDKTTFLSQPQFEFSTYGYNFDFQKTLKPGDEIRAELIPDGFVDDTLIIEGIIEGAPPEITEFKILEDPPYTCDTPLNFHLSASDIDSMIYSIDFGDGQITQDENLNDPFTADVEHIFPVVPSNTYSVTLTVKDVYGEESKESIDVQIACPEADLIEPELPFNFETKLSDNLEDLDLTWENPTDVVDTVVVCALENYDKSTQTSDFESEYARFRNIDIGGNCIEIPDDATSFTTEGVWNFNGDYFVNVGRVNALNYFSKSSFCLDGVTSDNIPFSISSDGNRHDKYSENVCATPTKTLEYSCSNDNDIVVKGIPCGSGEVCENGACVGDTSCSDPDDEDLYSKNTVTLSKAGVEISSATDYCSLGEREAGNELLVEQVCKYNKIEQYRILCDDDEICDDGACVRAPTCTDLDNQNIFSRNDVVLSLDRNVVHTQTDYCSIGERNAGNEVLVELVCGTGRIEQYRVTCDPGFTCVEGACVPPPDNLLDLGTVSSDTNVNLEPHLTYVSADFIDKGINLDLYNLPGKTDPYRITYHRFDKKNQNVIFRIGRSSFLYAILDLSQESNLDLDGDDKADISITLTGLEPVSVLIKILDNTLDISDNAFCLDGLTSDNIPFSISSDGNRHDQYSENVCATPTKTLEYSCSNDNDIVVKGIPCGSGEVCENGACVGDTSCSDPDDEDFYSKNTVTLSKAGVEISSATDYCSLGERDAGNELLVEQVCKYNKIEQSRVLCDDDEICDDGACVRAPTCTDLDNQNIFSRNDVVLTLDRNVVHTQTDYCSIGERNAGNEVLVELVCGNGRIEQYRVTCDPGFTCIEGACVPPPDNVLNLDIVNSDTNVNLEPHLTYVSADFIDKEINLDLYNLPGKSDPYRITYHRFDKKNQKVIFRIGRSSFLYAILDLSQESNLDLDGDDKADISITLTGLEPVSVLIKILDGESGEHIVSFSEETGGKMSYPVHGKVSNAISIPLGFSLSQEEAFKSLALGFGESGTQYGTCNGDYVGSLKDVTYFDAVSYENNLNLGHEEAVGDATYYYKPHLDCRYYEDEVSNNIFTNLNNIFPGEGYLLDVAEDDTLVIGGLTNQYTEINLYKGNDIGTWIGYPLTYEQDIYTFLNRVWVKTLLIDDVRVVNAGDYIQKIETFDEQIYLDKYNSIKCELPAPADFCTLLDPGADCDTQYLTLCTQQRDLQASQEAHQETSFDDQGNVVVEEIKKFKPFRMYKITLQEILPWNAQSIKLVFEHGR